MDTVLSGLVVVGCFCFVLAIYSRFLEVIGGLNMWPVQSEAVVLRVRVCFDFKNKKRKRRRKRIKRFWFPPLVGYQDRRVVLYGIGGIMASSSFSGDRFIRVAFCLGIFWGFFEIYQRTLDISKKALMYCGERLLEVGERERLAQLPERTQRTGEHQHHD